METKLSFWAVQKLAQQSAPIWESWGFEQHSFRAGRLKSSEKKRVRDEGKKKGRKQKGKGGVSAPYKLRDVE